MSTHFDRRATGTAFRLEQSGSCFLYIRVVLRRLWALDLGPWTLDLGRWTGGAILDLGLWTIAARSPRRPSFGAVIHGDTSEVFLAEGIVRAFREEGGEDSGHVGSGEAGATGLG